MTPGFLIHIYQQTLTFNQLFLFFFFGGGVISSLNPEFWTKHIVKLDHFPMRISRKNETSLNNKCIPYTPRSCQR